MEIQTNQPQNKFQTDAKAFAFVMNPSHIRIVYHPQISSILTQLVSYPVPSTYKDCWMLACYFVSWLIASNNTGYQDDEILWPDPHIVSNTFYMELKTHSFDLKMTREEFRRMEMFKIDYTVEDAAYDNATLYSKTKKAAIRKGVKAIYLSEHNQNIAQSVVRTFEKLSKYEEAKEWMGNKTEISLTFHLGSYYGSNARRFEEARALVQLFWIANRVCTKADLKRQLILQWKQSLESNNEQSSSPLSNDEEVTEKQPEQAAPSPLPSIEVDSLLTRGRSILDKQAKELIEVERKRIDMLSSQLSEAQEQEQIPSTVSSINDQVVPPAMQETEFQDLLELPDSPPDSDNILSSVEEESQNLLELPNSPPNNVGVRSPVEESEPEDMPELPDANSSDIEAVAEMPLHPDVAAQPANVTSVLDTNTDNVYDILLSLLKPDTFARLETAIDIVGQLLTADKKMAIEMYELTTDLRQKLRYFVNTVFNFPGGMNFSRGFSSDTNGVLTGKIVIPKALYLTKAQTKIDPIPGFYPYCADIRITFQAKVEDKSVVEMKKYKRKRQK